MAIFNAIGLYFFFNNRNNIIFCYRNAVFSFKSIAGSSLLAVFNLFELLHNLPQFVDYIRCKEAGVEYFWDVKGWFERQIK